MTSPIRSQIPKRIHVLPSRYFMRKMHGSSREGFSVSSPEVETASKPM